MTWSASLLDFIRVAAGGILVGLALGWVIARLIERVDDYLIETTLTTVLAFGAYLAAERLHLSGVLAVVAAGLVNGNIGPRGMSPTTRIVLFNFWEYVAFLANSLVFLLIGLKVNIPGVGPVVAADPVGDSRGVRGARGHRLRPELDLEPGGRADRRELAARAGLGRPARGDLPGAGPQSARRTSAATANCCRS